MQSFVFGSRSDSSVHVVAGPFWVKAGRKNPPGCVEKTIA